MLPSKIKELRHTTTTEAHDNGELQKNKEFQDMDEDEGEQKKDSPNNTMSWTIA